MPLTGPAAPGYSEIPEGQKAYFDYVNANGGACDRDIEYVVRDDGYNPTNTTNVVNQLALQDQVFGMYAGLGTPTHSAVLDFLNDEKVPDLFVSSGSVNWDQPEEYPYTFGWQPDYVTEGKIVGQYIKENFPDAKLGLFLQGDELGRDGSEGIKQQVEDQVVAEVEYTPGNTDVGAQISELQQAGADFVVGFNIPAYTALSHLTAQRLNYTPQWFHASIGADQSLIGGLLSRVAPGTDAATALEGTISTQYIPGRRERGRPVGAAVEPGLGRARHRGADQQLPHLRHVQRLRDGERAARVLRQPQPRVHRRRHRGAGRRLGGPLVRPARLLRGQPPRHHRPACRPVRGRHAGREDRGADHRRR